MWFKTNLNQIKMKKGILAVLAISTALFVTSCGKKGGLSEETKTAMSTFETSWKAAETSMTAMGATMATTFGEMTTMMAANDVLDLSKLKPEVKASIDSNLAMCTTIKMQMEKMKGDYSAAMNLWATDSQAYADWKKKAQEEKLADADFKAEIENTWTAKLATYNEQMVAMNEALTGIQSACNATCAAITGAVTPAK